ESTHRERLVPVSLSLYSPQWKAKVNRADSEASRRLLRDLAARATCFGQADRDRLLPARDLPAGTARLPGSPPPFLPCLANLRGSFVAIASRHRAPPSHCMLLPADSGLVARLLRRIAQGPCRPLEWRIRRRDATGPRRKRESSHRPRGDPCREWSGRAP